VDWSLYDFADLGCSRGGSLQYCSGRFGGRGVGIDIDPAKVEEALAHGTEAVLGDAVALDVEDRVRYVSMMDFLEHLPGLEAVEEIIAAAAGLATDFIFIRHPSFEGEDYLTELGLRQYWWDWRGHPAHIQVSDYCQIFERLGLGLYTIRYGERVVDSSHYSVLSATEPPDQGPYDPALHRERPRMQFRRAVWRSQDLFVALRPFDPRGDEWESITSDRS